MLDFIQSFPFGWRDILDITVVTAIFYYILRFIQGTRASAALGGLLVLLVIYVLAKIFGLFTLVWLMENLFSSLFLVIVILFHPDIRQALASIDIKALFRKKPQVEEQFVQTLAQTALELARYNIGAIIVLQRSVPLGDLVQHGVTIDGAFSRDLLYAIFYPKNPLHDGAAILSSKGRIQAAGCVLPLTQMTERQHYGTRHRAALGVTEVSDAIALVVSEERGEVTVAQDGHLSKPLNYERLERILINVLSK